MMSIKKNKASKMKTIKTKTTSETKTATKNKKKITAHEPSEKIVQKKKQQKSVKKVQKTLALEYKNMPHIIPKSYPDELIVAVKKLPDQCKQSDIIAAFNKFGALTYIQKTSSRNALIAFLTAEQAVAAIEAAKILVAGKKVLIKRRSKKEHPTVEQNENKLWCRTILVFRIDPTITEDDIKAHFKQCGKIESIKLFKNIFNSHIKIIFEKESSAQKALKLHNTVLKECTIHVRCKNDTPVPWNLKRTIVLLNPSGLTKIDGSQVTKVFKECGEIEKCDVYCYKNRLALISFKHEDGIKNALSLNGTTKHGLKIEVESYSTKFEKQAIPVPKPNETLINLLKKSKKSKVCIEKVAQALTEQDLENLFKTCGAVKGVTIAENRSAVVEFENNEGYCNAFTLHDCAYGGSRLKLHPFSVQEISNLDKTVQQKGKRNLGSNDDSQIPKKIEKESLIDF